MNDLRDLIMRDICESCELGKLENAVNDSYDYIYESVTKTLENFYETEWKNPAVELPRSIDLRFSSSHLVEVTVVRSSGERSLEADSYDFCVKAWCVHGKSVIAWRDIPKDDPFTGEWPKDSEESK